MPAGIHVFGVRHLSPMGAYALRGFLDRVKPKVVLVEGPADATVLIDDLVHKQSVPPVAMLAYTTKPPVETLLYPLARYSPEYQALRWAKAHGAEARFIDLPSQVFLGLGARRGKDAEVPDADGSEPGDPDAGIDAVYDRFAQRFGEPDYDTFWERHFEHNAADDSYRLAAMELGRGLRDMARRDRDRAEDQVREAHMRRVIAEVLDAGVAPADVVAVVGAFHAPVLDPGEHGVLDDESLAALPRLESALTLMPYSYLRLSSQSGYGAGNSAPAYFELFYDALDRGALANLPAEYLSRIVRHVRASGTSRSTAEVIEGVRLARALSGFKEVPVPTLRDLHDAAVTLIGHGELGGVQDALARVDVGTAVGKLAKGVAQTSIQADLDRELGKLKLGEFRTPVRRELSLDLRENRRVKSAAAAFLDLHRSRFLHRLAVIGVGFGKKVTRPQSSDTTWAEAWELQWTDVCEIELVESVLLGETVELACAFRFKTRLAECSSVADAASMVREASECGLVESMLAARQTLQALGSQTSDCPALALAAFELGAVIRYGDVRRIDATPLLPLVEELFVQGSLALISAANCDNDAARAMAVAIDQLNQLSFDFDQLVDEELWLRELTTLALADHLNPLLSGVATAILLERQLLSEEDLAREVSRRLSPGIDTDLGAGWFEGLAQRNRYSLLSRLSLWRELASYVASLDDEEFPRALVFLRRAFGAFSPREKRTVAENLGEVWGVAPESVSEVLDDELSEAEQQKLSELDDFDFDDL